MERPYSLFMVARPLGCPIGRPGGSTTMEEEMVMRFRALSIAALGLMLTVPVVGVAGAAAQEDVTASGNNRARIELDCDGSPETIKVTNRGSKDLKIRKLTSLVDPVEREPFRINETLKKGQSIKFEAGKDARGQNKLTSKEIFDDEDAGEGVVLRTSGGKITEKCS